MQQSQSPSFPLQIWTIGSEGRYVVSFGSGGIYLYDLTTGADVWHIAP